MPTDIDLTTRVELPRAELPQAEPSVLVIFGASGDLTRRKLIPALFHLAGDGVDAQWRLITPIVQTWVAGTAAPLPGYRAGSNGPAEADALLARNGHHWRAIADNVGACAR